jgi:hypothetical protein
MVFLKRTKRQARVDAVGGLLCFLGCHRCALEVRVDFCSDYCEGALRQIVSWVMRFEVEAGVLVKLFGSWDELVPES